MTELPEAARLRIDKWLWAARFFKTRAQATQAVAGGLVQVGGQRVKPSRGLAVGEELRITRGPETFEVKVLGLAERRGPAAVASRLYEESEASRQERERGRQERRLVREAPGLITTSRPNKRQRRLIRRFIRGDEES